MNLLLQFSGFICWLLETLDEDEIMRLRATAEHDMKLNQVSGHTRKALDFFVSMIEGKHWVDAELTVEAVEKFLDNAPHVSA